MEKETYNKQNIYEQLIESYNKFCLGKDINKLAESLQTESPIGLFKRIWFIFKDGSYYHFDINEEEFKDFMKYHTDNFLKVGLNKMESENAENLKKIEEDFNGGYEQ
jgi:hypothetical protein